MISKIKIILLVIFLISYLHIYALSDEADIFSQTEGRSLTSKITQNGLESTDVNIEIEGYELVPEARNNKSYSRIALPQPEGMVIGETSEDGLPELPVISTNLAIPFDAGVEIVASYQSVEVIDNIDIVPVQPPISESQVEETEFFINEEFYNTDAFYPGDLAEAGEPIIMRDIRFIAISIYPAQYNPKKRRLKIYRGLSVSVNYVYNNVVNPKTIQRSYISEAFYPLYRSMIANFDQIYTTLDVRRGGYLILAKDMFVDSLQELAEWKHQKGYDVYIAPTSEIYPNGNPNYLHVKDYIQDAYDTWEIPPEYVMIVGDEDDLTYSGIPDYSYGYYHSDHPYSMLEGSDYMPDVFVGRLSVDNMTQLRVAVAKILAYDRNPQMDDLDCWERAVSIGGNVYAVTPRLTVLWVRQLLLRNGFTDVDTSFRWSSGQSDPYLLGYFDEGPCIVSFRGWATSSGWLSPLFNITNLDQIQNHNKLAIIASVACATGDFGVNECFGEKWIRMGASIDQFKGGPAFLGSTDHSGHTRWHNPIMVGYYWGLFNDNIYHFAQAAVNGKIKLFQTFPRYIGIGGVVEKYFHTLNMLGDPEVEIRTKIPLELYVSLPSSIPIGMNFVEITVEDSGQNYPVSGAFVTAIKEVGGVEEIFEIGCTDETGNVTLPLELQTTGDLLITVTGRDLYPYQGNISIVEEDVAVGFDSFSIDDDGFGFSSGNGDGVANPHEIIELGISLKNHGASQTARNVTALLESANLEKTVVYRAASGFGDIAPGETVDSEQPFVIYIDSKAHNGEPVSLRLIASDDLNNSWESIVQIPVTGAGFMVEEVAISDDNNRLDPGDTVRMILTLNNIGSVDAEDVTGTITTADDYASIISANGFFGNISIGNTGNNSGTPMTVAADSATFIGRIVNFILHLSTEDGAQADVPFSVLVGEADHSDPLGPEDYGYFMYDDRDDEYGQHPEYDWVEICPYLGGAGQRITFDNYDDDSQLIGLPFDLAYYGESYSDIIVSIDGFISPDTTRYDMEGNFWSSFFNWSIPDPGNARGQISPFWDDLSYTGNNFGVFTYHDAAEHRFIIEWCRMVHRNTNAIETFEAIIYDPAYHTTMTGDSEILFQYDVIINDDDNENYASVGCESFDETTGLEYSFDGLYAAAASTLENNMAIKITTNTGRGGIAGNVELENSSSYENVKVSALSGQYRYTSASGDYRIKDIPPGASEISAEITGFFPGFLNVDVQPNLTIDNIDFTLEKCPIPSDFEATEGLGNRVELYWSPVNHQDLSGYNIYRGRWENGIYDKLNTLPVSDTLFVDYSVPDSGVFWYYITAFYETVEWQAESFASEKDPGSLGFPTGNNNEIAAVPDRLFLSQNYPNPFNQSAIISYGLPEDSYVRLEIYDILGRTVETIIDKNQQAGYHQVKWDADGYSSGIYFYQIQARNFTKTRKMLLLK